VEVVIGKIKMIREIDGGSSHLSQNSTIAHFGLGAAALVDSVMVTWIGRNRQILTNQKVNTLLTVVEHIEENANLWIRVGLPAGVLLLILIFYRLIKKSGRLY